MNWPADVNSRYITRKGHKVIVRGKAFSAQHGYEVLFGQTEDGQILYWDLDGDSLDSEEYDLIEMERNVRKVGW